MNARGHFRISSYLLTKFSCLACGARSFVCRARACSISSCIATFALRLVAQTRFVAPATFWTLFTRNTRKRCHVARVLSRATFFAALQFVSRAGCDAIFSCTAFFAVDSSLWLCCMCVKTLRALYAFCLVSFVLVLTTKARNALLRAVVCVFTSITITIWTRSRTGCCGFRTIKTIY